jgi:hypothetical protein
MNTMSTQANDPRPGTVPGPATGNTNAQSMPAHAPSSPVLFEPSDAEVEAWAANERQRREAWLSGPTQAERAAWARRERQRRLAAGADGEPAAERTRRNQRYMREAQLAAEGAMSLLWRWSRSRLETLVRAGREWEEEFVQPIRSRRVPMDDDAD